MRERPISIPVKLAFGSGQVAESIKSNSFELFLLFYYVQVLGLNPVWTGTAMLVALVMDAITDPVIGSISDNFKSRWGRRAQLAGLGFIIISEGHCTECASKPRGEKE